MEHHHPIVDKKHLLLIDKPAGLTSFGVVARVRSQLSRDLPPLILKNPDGTTRQKRRKVKVGHTGTLDPFATGLLILLTHDATKHAQDFLKLDKEYLATIHLGATSSTGDPEGEITPIIKEDAKFTPPTLVEIEPIVYSFVGPIQQRVPNFSAIKINGQRAYQLARAGKSVEMPVRPVMIYELEILAYHWPELKIRCRVSSGTYIRTLGEDIGTALGTGAYLTALRRTQIGPYRIEDATTLDDYLTNSSAANS